MTEEAINLTGDIPAEAAEPSESATEQHVFTPEEQELLDSQAAEEGAAAEEAEPTEKQETKPGIQKRFDTLTKQREDERRRADRLEGMLERALQQGQKPEEATPEQPAFVPATRIKPTMESCEYDPEQYADQLTDWKFEQREAQNAASQTQREQQTQQQQRQQTFEDKRVSTMDSGAAKFPDFEDQVLSLPPEVLHAGLAEAIFETEEPADVAYYLGKNPEEAARISKLSPLQMAIAMGRIEGKAIVPIPAKKKTNAPEPVTPVGSNAEAGAEPDAKKDPDAWIKWERKRCFALGKRY